MGKKHCCDIMHDKVENWSCWIHKYKYQCQDAIIDYNEKFDEYWIIIHWDKFSYISINYCPWCWVNLKSKRELWFSNLEKLWFKDPLFDDKIPIEYNSNKWYNKI